MKLSLSRCIRAVLLLVSLQAGTVLACDAIEDGCLGCTDDELQICMQVLVAEICDAGGGQAKCDQRRVYDDAERHSAGIEPRISPDRRGSQRSCGRAAVPHTHSSIVGGNEVSAGSRWSC